MRFIVAERAERSLRTFNRTSDGFPIAIRRWWTTIRELHSRYSLWTHRARYNAHTRISARLVIKWSSFSRESSRCIMRCRRRTELLCAQQRALFSEQLFLDESSRCMHAVEEFFFWIDMLASCFISDSLHRAESCRITRVRVYNVKRIWAYDKIKLKSPGIMAQRRDRRAEERTRVLK